MIHGLVEAESKRVAGLEGQGLGGAARGTADIAPHVVGVEVFRRADSQQKSPPRAYGVLGDIVDIIALGGYLPVTGEFMLVFRRTYSYGVPLPVPAVRE